MVPLGWTEVKLKMSQSLPELHPVFWVKTSASKTNYSTRTGHFILKAVLHQHGRDGVLDVAIGSSSQQLPEAALGQLHRAFLFLLWCLQWRRGAADQEWCRWGKEWRGKKTRRMWNEEGREERQEGRGRKRREEEISIKGLESKQIESTIHYRQWLHVSHTNTELWHCSFHLQGDVISLQSE